MKKLLLSLLAVAGLSLAASADEVKFDFVGNGTDDLYGMTRLSGSTQSYNPDPTTVKDGAVTITLTGNTRLWKDGLRCYKGSAIEITAPGYEVTGVTFGSNYSKFNYGTSALASADWTGKEETVKFTCNLSSKNAAVSTLTITIEKKGDASKGDANLSYAETNFTAMFKDGFTAPKLVNPNNLAVTYTSSNEAVATVAADGKVTLVGVGTTKITASSAETAEFNAGSAFYNLTVVKAYDTVAEFYTVGANNKGLIGFDLIVTYVNGANCYAQTEDGEATLIYGSTSYEVGDIIPAGWEGQYSPFNGLDEIKPVGTMPAASGTTTFVPAEVTSVSKADMNRVVVLKNVKFDAATATGSQKTNFDGTVDDVTYTFRNNFADVPSVEAGLYNVKLAVSYYVDKNNNETLQLYPIAYTAITETGIDDVVVDENAPVEYYNLQGVRVANPENGLYIRRQGNKATKVLVK